MIIEGKLQTDLLNVDFVEYCIILPATYHKTLYWLHGYKERYRDIICRSHLENFAEKYHTAIVIPDLPDTYYMNHPWENCYTEDFLIQEFLPYICKKYHLPSQYEDTFIAGASMGGFGSLLIGSHFPELFGKIACISGAFIIDDILIGNPEVIGNAATNFSHFQNLFGDIPSLMDCEQRNPMIAAAKALENHTFPSVFMACGKKDMLYTRNVKFRDSLKELGADITWMEMQGGHNWECFNLALEDLFQWLND